MAQFKKIARYLPGARYFRGYANILISKFKITGRDCPVCRKNDSFLALKILVDQIRSVFNKHGLAYIEHQQETNKYYFYLPYHRRGQVKKIIDEAKIDGGFTVKFKKVLLSNNKYEVDGSSLKIPETTEEGLINPRCPCGSSAKFLRRWTVRIAFYSDHDHGRLLHLRNNLARVLPPEQPLPAVLEDLWKEARKKAVNITPVLPGRVNFPIDLVYTWVNDDDPQWQQKKAGYEKEGFKDEQTGIPGKPKSASNRARYRNRNELLYSLRSVYMYAPFVRNIYIVTDGQVPEWLDLSCSKVRVVFHRALFDDQTAYPVFSNRPIEYNIPRIDGLAEHFIYMNDDFFFCAPVGVDDFFCSNGIAKVFTGFLLLDARELQSVDRATVASHKNAASAFERKLGVSINRHLSHAPYTICLAACREVEKIFAKEIMLTKKNRFRSWNDITWSHLVPHYMLYKGYAVPSTITSGYVDVQDINLPDKLTTLAAYERIKTLCINDTDIDSDAPYEKFLIDWLQRRFPVIAPWEKEGSPGHDQ